MTGQDARNERIRRGLSLAQVAAHLEREDGSGRGVSRMRVSQLERKPLLTEEEAGRIATAILDAQWERNRSLLKVGS